MSFNLKVAETVSRDFVMDVLQGSDGKPVILKVLPSNETVNRAHFAKMFEAAKEEAASEEQTERKDNAELTAEDVITFIDQRIDLARKTFPGSVVIGWQNVTDKDGNAVEFSAEGARELLALVPAYAMQALQNYCANAANFTEFRDVGPLAKNSRKGSSGK